MIQARGERIPVRHLSEQGIHLAVGQGGERLLLGVILADNHLQSEAVRHQRQIVGVNALITFLVAVIDDGRPLGSQVPTVSVGCAASHAFSLPLSGISIAAI